MKYFRALAGLTFMLMIDPQADAASADADSCERLWVENSGRFAKAARPDYPGLLKFWQSKSGECRGTVVYEARLALIYSLLGDSASMRRALLDVRNKKSKYSYLVELMDATADFSEVAQVDSEELRTAKLALVQQKLTDYVSRYPNVPDGIAMLGGAKVLSKDFKGAIPLLKKADQLATHDYSRTGLYRNLAVAYAETGQFEEGISTANRVLAEDKTVTADPTFMFALIKIFSGLNRFGEAQTAVKVIVNNVPASAEDPEFKKAVDFLFKKMKDAGLDVKE